MADPYKFLTALDLNGNQLLNALFQMLAAAPGSPQAGRFYLDTTSSPWSLRFYDGTSWVTIGPVVSVNGKVGVVLLTQDDVGDGSTYVRTHNDLTDALVGLINGALQKTGGTMSGAIAMGSNKITGLADGTADQDAVTVKQLNAAKVGALKPSGSVTFANLPALNATNLNKMVNVTDAFTTTSDFAEGSGKAYPAGTNVAVINTGTDASPTYKYDAMTGLIDLSAYATLDSPAFTGAPTAPTPTAGDNSTKIATTAFVQGATAKTATGTIGTSSTSVTVSFTGAFLGAYATMGGSLVVVDIAPGVSSVTFATSAAPSSAVTCVVVYQ